jgi:DNA ligase-1
VRLADGREFKLGTGFSNAERETPPPLGSTVTFRYSGFTKTGLPRFAVFLHLQEDF